MGASYGKQKRSKSHKLNVGRFTAMPHNVIHSAEYRALGFAARSLLFDIAAQFGGLNNGRLVCCMKYLKPLGWTSNDTVSRALKQLKDSGLIIQTRQGMRPPCSQAAWFAIGWLSLDVSNGLDIEPTKYQRCKLTPIKPIKPINGVAKNKATPSKGIDASLAAPIGGAVDDEVKECSTPLGGEYIYLPSARSNSSNNHQQINSEWINANAGADAPALAMIH
jgi:hypothetical protein